MNRKEWMVPREDSIGRSLTPFQTGRTERAGRAKRASMLLACVAAALVLSTAAFLYVGDGSETTEVPDESQKSRDQDTPIPPWNVMGQTFADDGVTPISCTVTVTNERTGLFGVVISDSEYGFYEYDMNLLGTENGDTITVLAETALLYGETNGIADKAVSPYLYLNVIVNLEIPEFPLTMVLPVVGIVALLVGIRRRRKT